MQRSVIIKLFLNEFVGVCMWTGSNERIILIFSLNVKEREKEIEKTKGLTNSMRLVRAKPIESRMVIRTR
jgi:hypothetical protein